MTVESRRETLFLDHRGLCSIPVCSLLLSLTTFGKLFKTFYLKKKNCFYLFIYFWLLWTFLAVCGLSLAVASRGSSLVATYQLLFAAASLTTEHGLQSAQFSSVARRLSFAPRHVESSQNRDGTHVHCTGRQVLNHWTAREVRNLFKFCLNAHVCYVGTMIFTL